LLLEKVEMSSMRILEIEYPDDLLRGIDEPHLRAMAREALYARLYEQGLLSSGRAAQLLGMTRWDFLDLLGRYGVSYFDEDIDQDEAAGRVQP
jgi:predicted HTH domain antitoxin